MKHPESGPEPTLPDPGRKPEPNPQRDAGVALFLCGLGLLGLAWLAIGLAGWPVAFIILGAWLVGIWTAHAAITLTGKDDSPS